LITVRQRPGTAKGVLFVTVEDETGYANLVIWGKTFEVFRKVILQSKMLMVVGKLQIEGEVIHVIAESCHNMNRMLRIGLDILDIGSVHKPARADEKDGGGAQGDLFKSRDFK